MAEVAISEQQAEQFVRESSQVMPVPLCPELELRVGYPLVRELILLPRKELPPPYWAFLWGSGQALARYLFDHPEQVRDRAVLDLGAGSGIVAIAAARCGAHPVTAAERDHYGQAAVRLNARHAGVDVAVTGEDLIGRPPDCDVVLAADVFYVAAQAQRMTEWFDQLTATGVTVLVADPLRPGFPVARCELLAEYAASMYPSLEHYEFAGVYRWRPLEFTL